MESRRVRGGDQRGFTLIEAMTALAVLAIAMSAVTSLSVTTIRANLRARQVTTATNLARDKIDQLRAMDYWTITAGADLTGLTEAGTPGSVGAIYYRSWYVYAGPTPTTLRIKVVVQWLDATWQDVSLRMIVGV
jgi:prepilin-type N-terminal cleavage/methylation domain-containing protein